ncbi:cysteine dioxygenase [Actinocorallia sp. API 0066]|uniref:cysteine dioxygenase n=1 Tax=Actinocorallia sp. API 0066 TaxID=2896846 RepID=UPI001E455DED|nr:cysteine dioxygenase family protein [Actinocorallia sp. API 0066]MCD0448966.1 cysteine dioxygenase [Actinocorallia sp. API 0066]
MTLTSNDAGTTTLAERARLFAETSDEWLHRVRLDPQGRWYERLDGDEDCEVWIISWLPGQSTGFHDHGGSAGAFAVVLGELEEATTRSAQIFDGGRVRPFGRHHIHDVRNTSTAPAVSVHVYSPPLSTMNRYDLTPEGELIVLQTETADDW